ncbi:hypothetical protein BDN70DRAFT_939982 [Pholiota conissans]|uniref:Uncharacterized protein n=1 Tax=Pholiota conissans TaxID=109636 RepID=A0A9P5YLS6_9AGAR|nr:hypothetical protein BDN70DRAFT_939982 [Pholiota conissans]
MSISWLTTRTRTTTNTDNAKSNRVFKKISKLMLDKEKGRSIEELEAPLRCDHSTGMIVSISN